MRRYLAILLSLVVQAGAARAADSGSLRDSLAGIGVSAPRPVQHDTAEVARTWKSELRHGRVNFEDTTLHYPKFTLACRKAAQWYQDNLNHYDTAWVTVPAKKWKVMLKNNNWLDKYECRPEGVKFSFDCKMTSSVGAYLSYSGLTVGYSIDIDRLTGGRATSRKLELSLNCAKFSADYYLMRNRGEMTMTISGAEVGGKYRFKNFTGLWRRSWGISAYRYFNDSRYSQTAAYNCGKRQLRPAGSFMAGFSVTRQTFDVVADQMPDIFLEPDEDDDEPMTDETLFDYADYCLGAGYGYNMPFARNWLANATLLLQPGYKRAHSRASSDGGSNFFSVNGKLSVAMAYDQGSFFVGVHGYVDSHFFNTGQYKFRSFLIDITAIAGVRF